jgi:hypothetical protein
MACINALEQDTTKDQWVGTSIKTGETKVFNSLDDYKQYVKNLEVQGTYCAEIDPIYNIKYTAGKNTTETGFLEFKPRDPVAQAKYDALSPTWEGVASSDAAIARGEYSLDAAEKTRKELRAAGRVPPSKENFAQRVPAQNCVIQ